MAIFWLYLLIWATAAQVVHQWTRQRGGEGGDVANSLQVDGSVEQNLESFGLTGQFGTHLSSELKSLTKPIDCHHVNHVLRSWKP